MKKGTIVRRIQGPTKYGRLPVKALETDWIILNSESRNGELWYRCNTTANLARAGNEKDEWGKICTVLTDSTIFLPEELQDTGRCYPL